ncbi:MAG: hypothetical protein U5R48_10685 [Gammaproteobacteria bacterium]|nr:hypothetical protein [Gammaproteobacteria bacterium]
MGNSAVQRGPLWWAAHHRHHHKHSDTPEDTHSPVQDSFWWSHMLWFLANGNYRSRLENIRDFEKYPELRFLDRFDILVPVLSFTGLFLLGSWVGSAFPQTGTSGWQVLVWAASSERCSPTTPPSPSTRWSTCSAASATRPGTNRATIPGSGR